MEFWVDVGGTFTDCLARTAKGELARTKVLSSGIIKGRGRVIGRNQLHDHARCTSVDSFWRGYGLTVLDASGQVLTETRIKSSTTGGELQSADALPLDIGAECAYELSGSEEAPIVAIRQILGLRLDDPIPAVSVRLGTTRGTNALLTRRGARTALVTTKGFGDALYIGYQDRPNLFDLNVRRSAPLYSRVVEVNERVDASGQVRWAIDLPEVRERLGDLKADGIQAIAVCFLNAYANPAHEQAVAQVAAEIGFDDVSVSSEIAPVIKFVARGDTTVLNAYLNPVLQSYVARIQRALGTRSQLRLLTSAGGLVRGEAFAGKDSILSGPAGGVVGSSRVCQAAGFERAIGFDMGGTSTDVSRFDGQFELQYEAEKAGVRVVAPMMAIETVAAGGGSICWFDGTQLRVGPDSAGASPGPACYGRGGPLTVTDLNVLLGRIPATQFPFPLDVSAIDARIDDLREQIRKAAGREYSRAQLAEGLIAIANTNMAHAIRSISIAKGYDPKNYVLAAFGGAAPQHACDVASLLGMRQVLVHPDAGLLSAVGIGAADVVRHKASGLYRAYEDVKNDLSGIFAALSDAASREVIGEGVPAECVHITSSLDLRFQGLDAYLTIPQPADGDYLSAYYAAYQRMYGDCPKQRGVEAVMARVQATGRTAVPLTPTERAKQLTPLAPRTTASVFFNGRSQQTGVYQHHELAAGSAIDGPAIIVQPFATVVTADMWTAEVLTAGEILLTRRDRNEDHPREQADASHCADPIALEIFHHHFASIATQMGITLRNTSSSVNVKERLDFSCAVFTAHGDLVANAPHIPVHLGAMGETVRAVLQDNPQIRPGDVFVTNDPYRGGSHLPDVTVVTPVFASSPPQLAFFTASRAHHAEIGGIAPGSMPPQSRTLADEGVLIGNFRLASAGEVHWEDLKRLLLSAKYPTRNVGNNLADIRAQAAANLQGAQDLLSLVNEHSLQTVLAYTQHIQAAAESKMRRALSRLPSTTRRAVDYLDDGTPICVTLTIDQDQATVDFTDTGPVVPGNLNANRAIVTAAVMYSFRCLLDEDIPLNQGVLAPIQIVLPECLLNPRAGQGPEQSPAVAGGNVETSQRVVDVILAALDAAAASQGTMNNFTFGDAKFGYYETICGGAGATKTSDGESAIHTHMTNTRLTDPEVFEQRFPARVLEFSIRRGSGGRGQQLGGDGAVRRIEFLRELEGSLLTQRRGPYPPFGLHGGEAGQVGVNRLIRASGEIETLANISSFRVAPGDILEINTPGGGGWGQVADAAGQDQMPGGE